MTTADSNWPMRAPLSTTSWGLDDVRAGDLVFSSKEPGADLLESLNRIAGQPWRHVGAVVEREDELHVVEIDKNRFGLRPLTTFVSSFYRCGAARLALAPKCTMQATALMEAKIDADHFYAWDDLFLAGVLSITQRGIFVGNRARVRAALDAALAAAKEGQRARSAGAVDSFTCSGFLQWAYEQAVGDCSIEHDRWRRIGEWPPRLTSLDDLLADAVVGEAATAFDLDALYGELSLLEALELTETTVRAASWRPKPDQLGEAVRVLGAAVAGYVAGELPDRLVTDGRWVTPGDIWESRSISERGLLMAPSE